MQKKTKSSSLLQVLFLIPILCMATCAIASPNPSLICLFFSNSSIPPKPLPQSLQFSSSTMLSSSQILEVNDAVQAVSLAYAAAQQAQNAVSLALELQPIQTVCFRKNRRRRRTSQSLVMNAETSFGLMPSCKSLSSEEEEEISMYLKEGSRIELVRKRVREEMNRDPTVCEWAKAVGMKKKNLEKLLCKDRESRDRITTSYRRLVISIAINYLGKGLTFEDLLQEGSIGLLRGAEKFDRKKGCKMSTYVYWWIKQAIVRAIAIKSRAVRLPGSLLAKIVEASISLSTKLGRLPTYDEIAEEIDTSTSNVRVVFERSRFPISVDQPWTTETGRNVVLKDILSGPEGSSPESIVGRKMMKQDLQRLLKTLNEREESIIRLYFGLNGETSKSFEEIGRLLNLSRERVRQLYGIAIEKLQNPADIANLKVYLML